MEADAVARSAPPPLCLRYALIKLPKQLTASTSPVRKARRRQFHTLGYWACQCKDLRVFALGQQLRHLANHVATTAGMANGKGVRQWLRDKNSPREASVNG